MYPDQSPPCGQCRPILDENNWEAWEIYQFASMSPWGVSMTETFELAKNMGSADPLEVCLKVAEILTAIAEAKKDQG